MFGSIIFFPPDLILSLAPDDVILDILGIYFVRFGGVLLSSI